jgi:hypothetical protein
VLHLTYTYVWTQYIHSYKGRTEQHERQKTILWKYKKVHLVSAGDVKRPDFQDPLPRHRTWDDEKDNNKATLAVNVPDAMDRCAEKKRVSTQFQRMVQ